MTSTRRLTPLSWDNLEETEAQLMPLYALSDIDDEKKVLDWANQAAKFCENYYRRCMQIEVDNTLLYEGLHWSNQDRSYQYRDRQGRTTRRSPRVVVNHLADFVDQWVSRLTRYRPAVRVFPTNSEYEDECDAKMAQMVLDHIWYTNKVDKVCRKAAFHAKVCGNAYVWCLWDPTKGDLDRAFVEQLKASGGQIQRQQVFGEAGPVMNSANEPMMVAPSTRIGDINYIVDPPWMTWDEPIFGDREPNWAIKWSLVDVDTLRVRYPEHAKKLTADQGMQIFDESYGIHVRKLKNQIVQYELYHKHHEFMGKGRYLKWTGDCLLENKDLPYQHGMIPRLHFSDIDRVDVQRGMGFFQRLFPLQHQINACASLIYKALVLYSHPKILMPDGACNIEQLADESTVVSFQGSVPPQLMTYNPVAQQLFQYMDKLEETAEKLSGIFTMSRGQAPSGVRAAKALRVLEDQEDKRSYITITKYNDEMVINNAKLTLSTAGEFYRDDDGRLARVLGKNNEYFIEKFKTANLAKPYDIRIEQTTALSRSPSARFDEAMELMQVRFDPMAPLSREQFFSVLDFGNVEEMKDTVTRAYNCAKSENEDLLSEKFANVAEPDPGEDLTTHWKTHRDAVQSRSFKSKVPPEQKEAIKAHIIATEYLMFMKAFGTTDPMGMTIIQGNPTFAQKLQVECPDWPLYFNLPAPEVMSPAPPPGALPPDDGGLPPGAPPEGDLPPEALPPPLPEPGVVEPAAMPTPATLPEPQPIEGLQ